MFANRGKVNYNKKREVYMSRIKSYIMDVEDFVNGYFDYDTETFKTSKEQILTAVKNEFKDNMSIEIAKDYVDRDFPNEFFAEEIANEYIDDQDAFNEIFKENV